ncbi:MAG: glucose-6-phosphate dehydrogenase assembly protein OpcA [Gaiellaceae bacterium]
MASVAVESWADDCATIDEIEEALAELRLRVGHGGVPDLRTSVLTHMAWVPAEWQSAATQTLAGLGARHPSRTLLLFPEPEQSDRVAARVFLECHPLEGEARQLCNEVVELRLGGPRAEAPASVAIPLLLPDLPVFLRWRGRPPFRTEQYTQMISIADRLVVDSAEWPDVPGAYAELEEFFEVVAVSDIAWRRTHPWREALSRAWPSLPDRIESSPAEAALVAGWLRSRAGIEVAREPGDRIPYFGEVDASDLLSDELNVFARDPIYEAAARIAGRF